MKIVRHKIVQDLGHGDIINDFASEQKKSVTKHYV